MGLEIGDSNLGILQLKPEHGMGFYYLSRVSSTLLKYFSKFKEIWWIVKIIEWNIEIKPSKLGTHEPPQNTISD